MYLIVKDNPNKVKEILKTNRDYAVGDKITGDLVMISKLAMKNKDIFDLGGIEKKKEEKPKVRGKNKERKKFGPKKDKMFDKKHKTK